MAKKPLEWDDLDLSTRAHQAIKNMGPYGGEPETPAELLEKLKEDYDRTVTEMLSIPNCGRQTVNEILEALEFTPPPKVGPKIVRFESDDELLIFLANNDGADPMKLDRATLNLALGLVARGQINLEPAGRIVVSDQGLDRCRELRMDERVELTISGTRRQINEMIEKLGDDHPYLDCLEDSAQELSNAKRVTAVLSG